MGLIVKIVYCIIFFSVAYYSGATKNVSNLWDGATISSGQVPTSVQVTGQLYHSWGAEPAVPSEGGDGKVRVPEVRKIKVLTTPAGMVLIPANEFLMGNPYPYEGTADELPQHKVKLRSFLIDVYEVPYYYYVRIREWGLTNGYPDLAPGLCGYSVKGNKLSGDHPVVGLTWFDCVKWCNARSEYEGLTPVYYTDKMQTNVYRVGTIMINNYCVDTRADGYRLPTEAEWECAARGPIKGRRFAFGEKFNIEYLNAKDSGDPFDNGTTPVGFYKGRINDYGLYDVMGNAFEWCWDWFGKYPSEPVENPLGPLTGEFKVLRGGSWNSSFSFFFRCSYRHYYKPHESTPSFGFRCVRSFY